MAYTVIVAFDQRRVYDFTFDGPDSVIGDMAHARRWLDDQFALLECEFVSPTGKVLIVDKILLIARNAGQQRFADREWGYRFARAAAMVLDRPIIRVDVEANTIGY